MALDELEERHQVVDRPTGGQADGTLRLGLGRYRRGACRRGDLGRCLRLLDAAPAPAAAPRPAGCGSGGRHPGGLGGSGHVAGRSGRRLIAGGLLADPAVRQLLARGAFCLGVGFRLTHRLTALGAAHRGTGHEHPPHVGHRLATDQPALVEQPLVLTVELLEGVVRQHSGTGLVGDRQHERVAAADRPGWRGDQLVVGDRLVERLRFFLIDPVTERGVDHDRHDGGGVFVHERQDGVVELFEARLAAAFGCDVRPVDHEVVRSRCFRHGERSRFVAACARSARRRRTS